MDPPVGGVEAERDEGEEEEEEEEEGEAGDADEGEDEAAKERVNWNRNGLLMMRRLIEWC